MREKKSEGSRREGENGKKKKKSISKYKNSKLVSESQTYSYR